MTNEAGLQFEGVPSERAVMAGYVLRDFDLLLRMIELFPNEADLHRKNFLYDSEFVIKEALDLMAKEKTNG